MYKSCLLIALLSVLLNSCAHNKIKKVRIFDSNKQKVVTSLPVKTDNNRFDKSENYLNIISETTTSDQNIIPTTDEIKVGDRFTYIDETNNIETRNEVNDDEEDLIKAIARTAGNDARSSKANGIASLILVVIPFLSIIGVITLVISAVKYFQANSARYITKEGERQLRKARIFLIINSVLYILLTSLIVVSILLI